ncbi:MAG: DUF2860 domain-containing protein [Anaerolineales bacterium]|nr:DUF2860 domain-containing protein [Anaerolineales bacterium]
MSWIRKSVLVLLVGVWAVTAYAIEPIPEKSGFSGFVNLGIVYLDVESNMIAGNDLGDVGREKIDSIFDSPDSESDVFPVINGEIAYTFASTRTQAYFGNSLEDFLRFDFSTLLGVRQELPDSSIVAASFVFSGIPTEVWEDPYVANRDRDETDRTSTGVRLAWDKILGSGLEVEYTYRSIDIDDELSGRTFLGLSEAEARLLDREGDVHDGEVLYLLGIGERHHLVPSFTYTRFDLDGDAMSRDRYLFQITHTYSVDRFSFLTNLIYGFSDYDKRNPIYNRTRDDDQYGGSFTVFYQRPFDLGFVERWSILGSILWFKEDSNISFYDSEISGVTLSALFRF